MQMILNYFQKDLSYNLDGLKLKGKSNLISKIYIEKYVVTPLLSRNPNCTGE
jgi:hypothetical protein